MVSVTHLDTLRDDFEQAQRTPVLTIHAPTVCDALYSSEDVSLAYPRVRIPTLQFLLPWGWGSCSRAAPPDNQAVLRGAFLLTVGWMAMLDAHLEPSCSPRCPRLPPVPRLLREGKLHLDPTDQYRAGTSLLQFSISLTNPTKTFSLANLVQPPL